MDKQPQHETNPDAFLHTYYQPPRPEFAAKLQHQLANMSAEPAQARFGTRNVRAAFAALAVCGLCVAFVLGISPTARAEAAAWLRWVGGMPFTEINRLPPPEPTTTFTETPRMPWPAAQARIGAPLPATIPAGYVLQPEANLLDDGTYLMASFYWHKGESSLHLNIKRSPAGQPFTPAIGHQSVEAIQINGQPAALVRGVWGETQWQRDAATSIYWRHGSVDYDLVSFAAPGIPPLSVEQLVQIAESVP